MTMNTRKTVLATLLAALAAAPLAVTPLQAQPQVQAAAHVYTQAELDQMLAPIALYPDSLLSQVLMAATYPIEVNEAARWARANPGLQGDDAVRAVQDEDWDPSVKSLVAFPQVLQRMDEHRDWTRSLGEAFLAQEPQLMDEVQNLRRRAQAKGNLRSDEQIQVESQGPVIVVRPARPAYVYVPYYDPLVVYGDWWWPAYQPVVWAPWPGYVRPYYRPGTSASFWWGRPVGLSLDFFFGDFDWSRRHVRVAHNSYYYRQPQYVSRNYYADRGRWQHDPHHRRGVEYRQADVRQRFASSQFERNANRQPAQFQAQPGARVLAQPQAPSFMQQRAERQAAPAAAAPAQAQPQPRFERRNEWREQRRAERQAAPAATAPAQAQPQPRFERRNEWRELRSESRNAAPQAQPVQRAPQGGYNLGQHPAYQRAQPAPVAPQQPRAERQERPSMPAAQAPQTPRAEAPRGSIMRILGQ